MEQVRMSELPFEWSGSPELTGLAYDFMETEGADLLARWRRHQAFWDARLAAGLDPYCRTLAERVGPTCLFVTLLPFLMRTKSVGARSLLGGSSPFARVTWFLSLRVSMLRSDSGT